MRDIRAKVGIPNSPQSSNIGQDSDNTQEIPPISDFRISGQSLMKENCYNSRTSDDIDMKLGLGTKLDKRNKTVPKKLTMTSCWQIVTSLSFFWFMANLELFGSRILDSEPLKSQPRLGLNCFSVRCICCYQQKRG